MIMTILFWFAIYSIIGFVTVGICRFFDSIKYQGYVAIRDIFGEWFFVAIFLWPFVIYILFMMIMEKVGDFIIYKKKEIK